MVTIRTEMPFDIEAREALLDRVWGPPRFPKTAERLREGREPRPGCRSSPTSDGASSAPCGCGISPPAPAGRRCCSARSRWANASARGASAAR